MASQYENVLYLPARSELSDAAIAALDAFIHEHSYSPEWDFQPEPIATIYGRDGSPISLCCRYGVSRDFDDLLAIATEHAFAFGLLMDAVSGEAAYESDCPGELKWFVPGQGDHSATAGRLSCEPLIRLSDALRMTREELIKNYTPPSFVWQPEATPA